jgi:hypothetical protein
MRPTSRVRPRAGEVLPADPPRRPPRPLRVSTRRWSGSAAVTLVFALYFGGAASLIVRRDRSCALRRAWHWVGVRRPKTRRVAAHRRRWLWRSTRRPTCCSAAASPSRAQPELSPFPVTPHACGSGSTPRPARSWSTTPIDGDPDRDRRCHASGVHPARPGRAAAPRRELGPCPGHHLPIRPISHRCR